MRSGIDHPARSRFLFVVSATDHIPCSRYNRLATPVIIDARVHRYVLHIKGQERDASTLPERSRHTVLANALSLWGQWLHLSQPLVAVTVVSMRP